MIDKRFKLTFVDHQCVRKERRTIVKLVSCFKQENFDKIFNLLGFTPIPESVLNVLKKHHYYYDYKLGGWKTTTFGTVYLQDGDVDDPKKATNMAMTKAKVKALERSEKCFEDLYDIFLEATYIFTKSIMDFKYMLGSESEALKRCLKTGYCDPNKK